MLDFDAGKLMIVAAIALVVIGPKDLPRVLRQIGQMVTKVRRMAGEFQNQFMDAMKEADFQDLKDEVAKIKDAATVDLNFDPAHDIKTELESAINTPAASVELAAPGSTSELHRINLPAASEIEPAPLMVGSSSEPLMLAASSETHAASDVAVLDAPAADAKPEGKAEASEPRKILIPRRRIASRFDLSTFRSPAMQRSRNILPARREAPEP